MSFDNPRFLLALFLLIPLIVINCLHYYRRRAILNFLGTYRFHASDESGSPSSGGGIRALRFRFVLSVVTFSLFLICIIFILAGPRGGSRLVSENRRGLDVVFAIDVSRSMDVRDAGPGGSSRLGQAAAAARELILALSSRSPQASAGGGFSEAGGIRFGAAIGKGRGVLAVPLTSDTEAALAFLAGLSGSAVTGSGTNLEELINAASSAFQSAFPSRRVIILLSDGEALRGDLDAALDKLKESEIVLAAAGFGSESGGPVPLGQDVLLGEGGYPVISYLRGDYLRDAAESFGGVYAEGDGNTAAVLEDYLLSFSAPAYSAGRPGAARAFRRETRPMWHYFALAALVFFGIAKSAEKGRRKHD
jgi:Ca-activated chloride channel family protein